MVEGALLHKLTGHNIGLWVKLKRTGVGNIIQPVELMSGVLMYLGVRINIIRGLGSNVEGVGITHSLALLIRMAQPLCN